MSADGKGSGPGRRAVLRWAWRMFRKEWRQQLLVLSLVTIAVAAAVGGASMAVNAASLSRDKMGNAAGRIQIDGRDPAQAQADVAAARERFGALEVIGNTPVAVPGSAEPLDLRAQDPGGGLGRPLLALRDGRFPLTSGEVALTNGAADRLSTAIGGVVQLGGRTLTVVGTVENPADLADDFALVPPEADAPADTLTLLLESVDRSGARTAAAAAPQAGGPANSPAFRLEVFGNEKQAVVAFVLIVVTLAMALVALIAAAGFVVVAHRRQRQLGLLAALGATERHLRLVMLANGVIVGVVAAVVGGALGILGWMVAAPAVEAAAGHRIDRLALPWGLIGECLALAVVAAAAAAWWPARALSRVPVMAALSRRPARPAPVHRSLALAVVLLGLGVAAIVAADPNGDVRPLVLIGGLVTMIIGLVFAAPGAIRALGSVAGRLPFAPRLALRDLVRHQARTAGALAAITLGLGIAVSIVVLAEINEYRPDEGNLSSRQLLVQVAGDQRDSLDPTLTPDARSRLDSDAAAIASAAGSREVVPLEVALNPATRDDNAVVEPVGVLRPIDHGYRGVDQPYVATPALLAHLGIDPNSIDPATELLTSLPDHPEPLLLVDMSVRPDRGERRTAVQRVDLPDYTSVPRSLITEHAMEQHGWVTARAGWLVESATPFTPEQISAAREAAAGAGFTVEARSAQDELAALRTGSAIVGALLALAIVAMAIGLLRGEAAADIRTLTATGATSRTRRALTASTAGALAVLGAVLSIAGAYATIVAAYHGQLDRLVPLPLAHLLLLAVGLPAVATAGGWLLAGREPRSFARQAAD